MVAVTVRDVPDDVRDKLAARAAGVGKSLQEYLRGLLVAAADKPSVDEVLARARVRASATGVRVEAEVVAALLDSGADGQWVTQRLTGAELFAPELLPLECANIIRRHELNGVISPDIGAQVHLDLLDLAVELWPYDAVAQRVWQLRAHLTAYDAAYAALAETLGIPLVTLDRRLARAPGLGCVVEVPTA